MKILFKTIPLISLLALSGCNININYTTVKYDHPELYTVGNIEITEVVNSLSINYIKGVLEINYSNDNKFRITETTDTPVAEEITFRSYLDDSGLMTIQPSAIGRIDYGSAKRKMVIEVPTSYDLNNISIDAVTVKQTIKVDAKTYDINNVTGEINIETKNFESIDVDVVTGNTNVVIDNDFDVAIDFEAVTGKLTSTVIKNNDSTHKIKVDSVTGNLSVSYK